MGKIISIVGGTAAIVIGVILALFAWREALILGLEFFVMLILVLGGLIATVAGISEIKDALTTKKEEEKKEEEKK